MQACPAVANPIWAVMFPFVRREEFYPGAVDENRSDAFQKIYEHSWWGSSESRSGPGSTLAYTARLRPPIRPDARENSQISPSTIVRAARAAGSHPHLASVLLQGRKSANIHASSGVIRGIPAKMPQTLGASPPSCAGHMSDS